MNIIPKNNAVINKVLLTAFFLNCLRGPSSLSMAFSFASALTILLLISSNVFSMTLARLLRFFRRKNSEEVGFEPTKRFRVYMLSKHAPSATRTLLQGHKD